MGFLHVGHLQLIRQARTMGDILIVSIFVNPYSSGRPKTSSSIRATGIGTHSCATPAVQMLYLRQLRGDVSGRLSDSSQCSPSSVRTSAAFPAGTFFRALATVVAKLFNCTMPHVALFGEKDFQQLAVIKRMVRDLDFVIQIIGVPTVREADGLAMSSRNTYLSTQERQSSAEPVKVTVQSAGTF